VSLDSVVTRFQQGASREKIVQAFPALKLSQVYGVIAYYLENEKLIEGYIAEGEREFERAAVPLSQTNPALCPPGIRPQANRIETIVTVRFLADEDLDAGIVEGCGFVSHPSDVVDGDAVLLDLAAAPDRILVSHDRRTMTRHFLDRLVAGKPVAGLFIVWSASQAEEWRNQIAYLPFR
jgi:hypothetical protein